MSESLTQWDAGLIRQQDTGGTRLLEVDREAKSRLLAWSRGEAPVAMPQWWDDRVRLTAELLVAKQVAPGAGVSYGHRFRTTEHTTLGLMGIGYGFGLPRCAGGVAEVSLDMAGERVLVPIVGRVAMNAAVLNLGPRSPLAGSAIEVMGPSTSMADWARWTRMSPEALLAGLANLNPVKVVDSIGN